MSFIAELKQAIYDLPMIHKPGRDEIAHFCEHHGIRVCFTRARTTWQVLAPSAIRPWWLILEPLKNRTETDRPNNKNNIVTEVHDNA
jgi:hypothetical protein